MKKNAVKLLMLYISAILGYLLFVSRFTIPVHLGVDEELYISMAKSFHYEGVFAQEGIVLNYTCVLYSMLLSLAYYFGNPQNIMFFFRTIGTIIMLSSIFPVFLLAKTMLKNTKTVWAVTILTIFLPSMMDVAYCMQEVLLYPVFLWTVYFVYGEIQEDNILELSPDTALIAIFAAIGYFTKTLFVFLPLLYCGYIALHAWKKRNFNVCRKLAAFLGIYFVLYGVGKLGIFWINDGIVGSNHYSIQFANLFPVDGHTALSVLSCIVFYIIALLFYWGVLPIILPIANRKIYEEKDQKFLGFLMLGIFILIAEIVISIVITEEGKVMLPHKLLYRYFQMFEIPLLLIYLKRWKQFKFPKMIWIVYVVVFGYLGVYFAVLGNRQRNAIIDAPVLLLIDNVTKKFLPGFNIILCAAAALLVFAAWVIYRKRIVKELLKHFHIIGVISVMGIFLINLYQLPYYHNRVAEGMSIQNDAISIADYIDKNMAEDDIAIYYLDTQNLAYGRAVYAYIPRCVKYVTKEDFLNLRGENILVITDGEGLPGQPLELELEVLSAEIYFCE